MKTAIICMLYFAGTAFASGIPLALCADSDNGVLPSFAQAKGITAHIFRKVDIEVNWVGRGAKCPAYGIDVELIGIVPDGFNHNALAYSRPFEGRTVKVFLDRVRANKSAESVPTFLAYVIAHEVGHILRVTDGHSNTGIMKAQFDDLDIREIQARRLAFSEIDRDLLREGAVRRTSLVAGPLRAYTFLSDVK